MSNLDAVTDDLKSGAVAVITDTDLRIRTLPIPPGPRGDSWEGKVEDGSEALLILHTRKDLVARIIDRTNKEHPDDTPQILAVPVTDANPGYRDWLLSSTAK